MAQAVFMGTPAYALPSLEALHAHHTVLLVVTQPDRRSGRGRHFHLSPVKEFALRSDLPVWQPRTLRTPDAVARLREIPADIYVTAAFGLILPPDVLALPAHGCLNVHASLLPRWRGAAPVSAAILHGDSETGATLMQTDAGLDTGPIVAQVRCAIQPDDTTETLTPRLAQLGADLLIETLPRWLAGEIKARPQPEEGVTLAPRLTKMDGWIDWHRSAAHIERMVRAFTPWPGTFTRYRGWLLKILQACVLPDWRGNEPPGTVLALEDGSTGIATGRGALLPELIQLAGKGATSPDAFRRGYRDFVGSVLGQEQ
jgi:methionyl-tRNA formyltransferase